MTELQRTTEWHSQRLGLVTASSIYKVMMASTTGGYRNYMAQLVCERLTGKPTETYKSAEMQHGIDTEPEARAAYSARTGLLVEEVGFIRHSKLEAGASPDGLVGEDGLIEIKCVQPATMLDLIDSRQVPKEHRLQMQWQMAVTGRDWCDYVVYQPKLPEQLKLLIIRVPRDQPTILDLTAAVESFTRELLERTEKLKEVRL